MILKLPFFILFESYTLCFVLKCCLGSVIRRSVIVIVIFVMSIPDLVETVCCVRLLKNVNTVFVVPCYSHFLS